MVPSLGTGQYNPWGKVGPINSQSNQNQLALSLGGGGARAAYQVGVLRAIAQRYPNLKVPLLTGVSAGAINIAHLGNHTGSFSEKVETLTQLWLSLRLENVFITNGWSLLWRAFRVGLRLSIGLPREVTQIHGMVNTEPLRQFLHRALESSDGSLTGIHENISNGNLDGIALTALSYGTGDTTTFFSGRKISEWERPGRRSVEVPLNVEHVMASAALPLFFPPVPIGNDWFGDGGIRLVNPLAPCVHLGAGRVLVISTHYLGPEDYQSQENTPPSPAVVLSALYNAVFLDQLDHDALQLERINELIRELPPEKTQGLREIDLKLIRPSEDLGALAFGLEDTLPGVFHFLMKRFGSDQVRSQDFMSTVMFHPEYIERLLRLGEQDGEKMIDSLDAFLIKSDQA